MPASVSLRWFSFAIATKTQSSGGLPAQPGHLFRELTLLLHTPRSSLPCVLILTVVVFGILAKEALPISIPESGSLPKM